MLRGPDACRETGISEPHAEVFQEVANVSGCIIACRAVGKYATGLIKEGYSSKGFHNKAKSCNWGPMAGFVLADPRFTKDKDLAGQTKTLVAAYLAGAKQVPLYISDQRRIWLQNANLFEVLHNEHDTIEVRAHKDDLSIDFELQLVKGEGLTKGMWAVMYSIDDRKEAVVPPGSRGSQQLVVEKLGAALPPSDAAQPKSGSLRSPRPAAQVQAPVRGNVEMGYDNLVPVMAVRDPHCTVPVSDYRSATTGDYDLFAVWPSNAQSLLSELDKRMIETPELEKRIKAKKLYSYEDVHQGNLTPRIAEVKNLLNAGFMRAGYTGGNMVHHSDQRGRPFVNAIDLPVFAVVPKEALPYCLETVDDMRNFIRARDGYVFMVNKGWRTELGLDRP